MEFSRQEYWSGLQFPSPGDLPNPGIEPEPPPLQADALPSEPPGKPESYGVSQLYRRQQTIFQSCCAILHCHQQRIKVLDAPYFCQYSMLSALLILTIPLGVLIYLIVALILYFPND